LLLHFLTVFIKFHFFFSSRRRHTRFKCDWSSDVCSSDLFVMAGVGAFYLLTKRDEIYGRTFLRAGVLSGTVAAILQLFPTGDMRSEERRVGKECRCGGAWAPGNETRG